MSIPQQKLKPNQTSVALLLMQLKLLNLLDQIKLYFLPDQYMAKYVQSKTKVQIISWQGTCIVHEKFSAQEIKDIKKQNPDIKVLTHPECPPEVIVLLILLDPLQIWAIMLKITNQKKLCWLPNVL